jgi:hypothetical protein
MAGLLAVYEQLAATVNAAPAYIVNDIYKRYINRTPMKACQTQLCLITL